MASAAFECSICLEDTEGHPMLIDNSPVCAECVRSEIVPKFYAAIEHEANYPVGWSGSIELKVQDFAAFFDDYPKVLKEWNEKMREYKTEKRIYCPCCSTFMGPQCPKILTVLPGKPVRSMCGRCRRWVCGYCGKTMETELAKHRCETLVESDPFAGLKLGKDIQICKNCGTPQFLRDGCNAVHCSVCKINFCYICAQLNPTREHWNRGGCPRFNQPGASNALFNESVVDVRNEDPLARHIERFWTDFHTLPPIPSQQDDSPVQSLHREQDIISLLHATTAWSRMIRHRTTVNDTQRVVADNRSQLLAQGETIPDWTDRFLGFLLNLLNNLDIYVFRTRLRVALVEYRRRDRAIQLFWQEHWSLDTSRTYPDVQRVLFFYSQVAAAKFSDLLS